MIKLMIISHTFARPLLWKRWKMMADMFADMDITLIAPEQWIDGKNKNYTFGKEMHSSGSTYESERFHVHLIDMVTKGPFGWISKKLIREIKDIKPDYIYHIGTHLPDSLLVVILIKHFFSRKSKVLVFSMRGPQHNITKPTCRNLKTKMNYAYRQLKLNIVKRNATAVFCHYPDAKDLFLKEGFKEPIYIQTQVGVDTTVYKPMESERVQIREKYNLGDAFVFGSAIRLSADKGVFEILEALPPDGNYKFLLMGAGSDEDEHKIQNTIEKRGLSDKVVLTGFISNDEMYKYWNAVDCAIHVPRTTDNWVETFSLALVQAMATQICVIGNDSGSVPYQIGSDGIVVPEGDITSLRNAMIRVMNDNLFREQVAKKMRNRAENCFDIAHLTRCLYLVIKDLECGIVDSDHFDMTKM